MGAAVLPIAALSVLASCRGSPRRLRRTVCMRGQHDDVLSGMARVVSLPLLLLHPLRWWVSARLDPCTDTHRSGPGS